MARRTKILATIGPASDSPESIRALIAAGLDMARLNLSHGNVEHHVEVLERIRSAAKAAGRPVGVLVDLPGPKVRSGVFPDGGVYLAEGSVLQFVAGLNGATSDVITVDEPSIADLHPGDSVILGDGAITCEVLGSTENGVTAKVLTGGRVQGRPGVHIPSERLRLTAPTDEDLRLLEIMLRHDVDFVAVSFVRGPHDLARVREVVGTNGPMIVAKIETAPAVVDIDAILEATDAVMVARGDLGIECPIEAVPHIQKQIIRSAVAKGVPVITATQMLESMIISPSPTRAEVSDVANAVLDGTDAVMLSAETAIGADPALVVATMARIAERAELEADYRQWGSRLGRLQRADSPGGVVTITGAMTHAAWQAAQDVGASAFVCCTRSGLTARALARFRPTATIIGLSPNERTARQLSLSWGVLPLTVDTYTNTDELVWFAVEASAKAGIVKHGDVIAVLAGAPDSTEPATDVLRLVRVR
ncbi:MAG: pyruvate kinase [Acidimicrobiia bacterium]